MAHRIVYISSKSLAETMRGEVLDFQMILIPIVFEAPVDVLSGKRFVRLTADEHIVGHRRLAEESVQGKNCFVVLFVNGNTADLSGFLLLDDTFVTVQYVLPLEFSYIRYSAGGAERHSHV